MVTGIVLETIDAGEDAARVWINLRVSRPGFVPTECAVYVERTHAARSVSPGDRMRWEGARAYWTPRGEPFRDYLLVRVGPAGAERPDTRPAEMAVYVNEDGG